MDLHLKRMKSFKLKIMTWKILKLMFHISLQESESFS